MERNVRDDKHITELVFGSVQEHPPHFAHAHLMPMKLTRPTVVTYIYWSLLPKPLQIV
jgi:hypothetical protein